MTNQSIPTINHYIALVKLENADELSGFIEEVAQDLINDLNLNIVKKITHTFHPKGTTLAFILSESHLLIHTWPELGMVHLDLVTCSHCSKKEFENSLKATFFEQQIKSIEIKSVNFD
jgi:S-adenosylmethionine decarboxylase